MKVTPYFPEDVRPVRKGVYELDLVVGTGGWFAYWNGKRFGWRAFSPESAYHFRHTKTGLPAFSRWRGLTKEAAHAR